MNYIGVGIGLVLVGVAIGVALGVVFGLALSGSSAALARKKAVADKPLPHPLGLFERDHHAVN
jgi:hypothetical protein